MALQSLIHHDRSRSVWMAAAIIVLTVSAMMLPALARPMMLHDSFWIDYVWASQFTTLLGEGSLYPRWLPWSHDGLGSPIFYYYPPLAFYVSGAFGLVGFSTYGSIIAAFFAAFLVSGIGAYFWLRDRSQYPLLGALFFTLGPYHWFDFYARGALAESVAIAALPWLALGLRRIVEGRGITLASIAYAAMILSHLPLALLTSIFLIAPYALLHRRQWVGFACACFLGIGLAAIYLVPAIGLDRFRDAAQLWATPFLRPPFWSIYVARWAMPVVLHVHLTAAVLAVSALIFAIGWRSRPAIYAVGIIVLALGMIPLLWSIPLLRSVQFPWRILPLAELALAAAFASRLPIGVGLRVVAMVVPLAWTLAVTRLPTDPTPDRAEIDQLRVDVSEYLPPGAKNKPSMTHWYRNPREGRIPPPQIEGWVVRPVFYFPAWSCGQIEPQTKLLMHRPGCVPRIQLTIFEKVGGLISALALLILLFQRPLARKLRGPAGPLRACCLE